MDKKKKEKNDKGITKIKPELKCNLIMSSNN